MTWVSIFEELRFVWELIAGELLFLIPFAKRKGSWWREIAECFLFSLLSMGYFPLLYVVEMRNLPVEIISFWYVFLALLTIFYSGFCFRLTLSDAVYIGIAGYAAQHVVYVAVNEWLALSFWKDLVNMLPLYVLISVTVCAGFYWILYHVFAQSLSLCGGQLMSDTPQNILAYILFLAALMFCTFGCQTIFHYNPDLEILGAVLDELLCLLILSIQYFSYRMILYGREQAQIQQMLQDGEANYTQSKELIELVNRNVHDLKHSLTALKAVDEEERQKYIHEMEGNIHKYQMLVHTDNEALNTILAEKSLLCDKENIKFSCSLSQVNLDFLSLPDLYTLLGNAIDNAIEGVRDFQDPEQRVISLSIQHPQKFISIQINNYYQGELDFVDGLPRTNKENALQHGYGLKSIRYLAGKYGGSIVVSARDHLFTLQIMLPEQN